MSGRGADGGEPPHKRPLSETLKNELRSALQLLCKNASQHAIALNFQSSMTTFITTIQTDINPVSLKAPAIEVSQDPIRALSGHSLQRHDLPLLNEARLAANTACQIAPVLCRQPVLTATNCREQGVSFENLTVLNAYRCPIEPFETASQSLRAEKPKAPPVGKLVGNPLKTRSHSVLERLPKIKSKSDPRFYALPLKKTPVPPHRFSGNVREVFKQALAEKANTAPANIQLKIVFERMDMSIFGNIQQDEQGNLLCTPRNEVLGKNQQGKGKQALRNAPSGGTYLVFGMRLDTKQELRALVPAAKLRDGSSPSGGNA